MSEDTTLEKIRNSVGPQNGFARRRGRGGKAGTATSTTNETNESMMNSRERLNHEISLNAEANRKVDRQLMCI